MFRILFFGSITIASIIYFLFQLKYMLKVFECDARCQRIHEDVLILAAIPDKDSKEFKIRLNMLIKDIEEFDKELDTKYKFMSKKTLNILRNRNISILKNLNIIKGELNDC